MTDFEELISILEADGVDFWILTTYENDEFDEDGAVEIEDADYWYEFNSKGKLVAEYEAD